MGDQGGGVDLGRWEGGNSTLQAGPRAGWLGEGACRFQLCACVCVCDVSQFKIEA